jgi:hypothetical protein
MKVESWTLETQAVKLDVTKQGGMVAPVTFQLNDSSVAQPYYVSPWQSEQLEKIPDPPVLGPLRGDFFCLPFGGDNDLDGEHHRPHGEAAYGTWQGSPLGDCSIPKGTGSSHQFHLAYQACPGKIDKILHLGTKEPWFATEHVVQGFQGEYPLGCHATLQGSEEHTWKLFVPPFDLGMVDPTMDRVGDNEYYSLLPGAQFSQLDQVPTCWSQESMTDCSRFPNRKGFVDILGLYRNPLGKIGWDRIGWTCGYNLNQGYLWYSLKDLRVLPATIMWMENHGRHGFPWLGRNCCIGLEETCTYMAAGRVGSLGPNPVKAQGIPTAHTLDPQVPLRVRTIQGVVDVKPAGRQGVENLPQDGNQSPPEVTQVEFLVDHQGKGSFRIDFGGELASKSVNLPIEVDLGWLLGES